MCLVHVACMLSTLWPYNKRAGLSTKRAHVRLHVNARGGAMALRTRVISDLMPRFLFMLALASPQSARKKQFVQSLPPLATHSRPGIPLDLSHHISSGYAHACESNAPSIRQHACTCFGRTRARLDRTKRTYSLCVSTSKARTWSPD